METKVIQPWTGLEKYLFRTFFVFFFVLIVPLNLSYYSQWFSTDWSHLHIRDMGKLSGSSFNPIKVASQRSGANDTGGIPVSKLSFLTIYPESGEFGLASYINWGLAFVIGLAAAAIWSVLDRKTRSYNTLYYFLAAGVSYAMLIQLQGLTFSKVFPTQMPDLALTQLNTPFGDIVAQKLYWIQFSFVHDYEIFAGYAELLIMLFLFFRPTRAIGAALALAMVGNIAFANHAYDGGIHLAASFYALGGAFVLWGYVPALWRLIVKEKDAALPLSYYSFSKPWERYVRYAFKTFVFGFYFLTSAYLHWYNYKHDSYKVPASPGLAEARGLYEVSSFRRNGEEIPYSPVDSLRWRDVTLEKWSTLSYSVFNTFMIHGEAGRGKQFKDIDRTYESAGTGGGRKHFHYEIDSIKPILHLQNKNKVYANEQLDLHYSRPSAGRIVLDGLDQYRDSVYIVLDRKEKTYPLFQNRRRAVIWRP